MAHMLCLNCFHIKGNYDVCPYCGYREGAPPNVLFQLKPGTVLQNRYIIGEAIGYGGFGITYKAYDITLSIIVAVKEFYPAGLVNRAEGEVKVGIFSGEKERTYNKLLKRFITEARNMALFAKESDIINVFAYFEANKTAYIIMEYIDRPILKTYLEENGKMQVQQACDYICVILTALQKIHDKGIVHNDISPDNIFVISPGQVKLFDFGAAKFQNEECIYTRSIVVKNGYAPPEQYRSNSIPDFRTDIYATGAVLYQMLTNEKPVESLDRMQNNQLIPPSKKGIRIQPYVEKALLKALSLNPEERFSSAADFKKALLTPEEKKKSWKWW